MELTATNVLLLAIGGVCLSVIGVLVDRLNFPQKPFRPRQVRPSDSSPSRDRTGAQIIDVDSLDSATERLQR